MGAVYALATRAPGRATEKLELRGLEDPVHLLEQRVRHVARDRDGDRAAAVAADPEAESRGGGDRRDRVLAHRLERRPLQVEVLREKVERALRAAHRPFRRGAVRSGRAHVLFVHQSSLLRRRRTPSANPTPSAMPTAFPGLSRTY